MTLPLNDSVGAAVSSSDMILAETLSVIRSNTQAVADLASEIRAERASRDADRLEMSKARESMDQAMAIGRDRIRIADEKRVREEMTEEAALKRAEYTEEIARTQAAEARRDRWAALRSIGAYVGPILRSPLGTLAVAAVGYLIASYLHAGGLSHAEAVQPEQGQTSEQVDPEK